MAEIKAFFFDQDGVIIDTERDGHRVAFNRTFEEFGYDVEWDVETYHELLQISGGKERMRHYLHTEGFGVDVPAEKEDDLIAGLHKKKTETFIGLIESGSLPVSEALARDSLSLPMFAELTEEQIEYVAASIEESLSILHVLSASS